MGWVGRGGGGGLFEGEARGGRDATPHARLVGLFEGAKLVATHAKHATIVLGRSNQLARRTRASPLPPATPPTHLAEAGLGQHQLAQVGLGRLGAPPQDGRDFRLHLGRPLRVAGQVVDAEAQRRGRRFVAGNHEVDDVAINVVEPDFFGVGGGVVEHGAQHAGGAAQLAGAHAVGHVGDDGLARRLGVPVHGLQGGRTGDEGVVADGSGQVGRARPAGGVLEAKAERGDEWVQRLVRCQALHVAHVQADGRLDHGVRRHGGQPVVEMVDARAGGGVAAQGRDKRAGLFQDDGPHARQLEGVEGAGDDAMPRLPGAGGV